MEGVYAMFRLFFPLLFIVRFFVFIARANSIGCKIAHIISSAVDST